MCWIRTNSLRNGNRGPCICWNKLQATAGHHRGHRWNAAADFGLGPWVLFEAGSLIANLVAVGLVGLAALGLWASQTSTHEEPPEFWVLESD